MRDPRKEAKEEDRDAMVGMAIAIAFILVMFLGIANQIATWAAIP